MTDKLDSQEFYELMQAYRHADWDHLNPQEAVEAFEAVKAWIRAAHQAELKALAAEVLPKLCDCCYENRTVKEKLRAIAEAQP